MVILFCISHLPAGGAERQVIRDTFLLKESGYEVHIAFGSKIGSLLSSLDPEVKQHPLGTQNVVIASYRLQKLVKSVKADILLTHMFWANKAGGLCTLFNKVPFNAFEHGLGLWRNTYHRLWIRMYSSMANNVVCCSAASLKLRRTNDKIDPKKLLVIHNSFRLNKNIDLEPIQNIDSNDLPKKSKAIKEVPKYSLENAEPFVIGYAGRFHKVKQINVLIQIAELLKKRSTDFKFLLLGDGPEKEGIDQIIREKNLGNYFQLTGFVKNPESYFEKMNCFVLPSKREDFSLALIEASNAGLPCIAFDVGGNSEIIQHEETGFIISPFDIEAMAYKIRWLKENEKRCEEMGIMASEYVQSYFTENNRLTALQQLIQKSLV